MNKFLLFIISVCFLTSFAFGQGTLIGVVSDSVAQFDLPGANVIIEGTKFGASTNLDGEYRINGIPAGSYDVTIGYIGYQSKTVSVDIAAGETKVLSVNLNPVAIEGEVITVTAQAQGQLQAINQQLASDKIANIVSEQRIQELPDFNAAAALSRLPGISTQKSSGEDNKVIIRGLAPKYNSIEIEGVQLSATGSAQIGLSSNPNEGNSSVLTDRSVDLTMVSPYMIRTIAVYKSLTPDMNANSIGGTVNMELREAPAEPRFDLLYQQGYTAKSNTLGNYRGVASGSMRFLSNKLGAYALINVESYDRDADNLDASYDVPFDTVIAGSHVVEVNTISFNRHIETRKRYGANLILDYEIPNGSFKFVNMFARLNSDYTDHNQTGNYDTGVMQWRLRLGENNIDQQMHSIKLDYDFGLFTADISASYTSSKNILDDSPAINFNQTNAITEGGEERWNRIPEDVTYLYDFQGDSSVILRSGNMFSSDYQEDKYTYKADFDFPFNFGNVVSGSFKFGGQIYNQTNTMDQETPYLSFNGSADGEGNDIQTILMRTIRDRYDINTSSTGSLAGNSFTNNDDELYDAFLEDKYGPIYYVSEPDILVDIMNYIIRNPQFDASNADVSPGNLGGWYDGPYQQLTNDYEYSEDYYAGYAMTRFNFLDFNLIGGVRFEKVESEFFAYNAIDQRNAQSQVMYDTTNFEENEFLLPMGQIKYSPLDWMDIRYAYTQTLARPDYQQISPKFTITQGNSIFTGNPELNPAKSYNHDLSFTFHNNTIGLLTISGFYKTVEDFVYSANYNLAAAEFAGIDSTARYQIVRDGALVVTPVISPVFGTSNANVYRPLNNPYDATIKGVEIDLQHNFWYMPKPLNNIVFGINYTRISSETKYPYYDMEVLVEGRDRIPVLVENAYTGRLVDQPNHVLNSYLGYDYKGFSARLSVVFQDNSARSAGREYDELDSRTIEYFRADFSARQKIPFYNSELFLDVSNLNDENNEWVQRSISGYQGIRNYGLTANLGIRVRY